jgi:hypothetical protein
MKAFESITGEILDLIGEWESRLLGFPNEIITAKKNSQGRTVKQIVGHMVDSASNNRHRIVHLQYQPSPLVYPDYANLGNNDRWIAIQNYQDENWENLVQLWKYSNIHICHVINHVNQEKLDNEWISALNKHITLKSMIVDYLPHLKLHLGEIEDLIAK